MRGLLASSALVLMSSGASAMVTNPPFVPPSGAVDHVVTVTDRVAERAPWSGVRRITHRAGWSRVEWVQDGGSRVGGYAGRDVTVTLSNPWRRPADAPPISLIVHRWPPEHAKAHAERTARRTSEHQVVLGEVCTVWSSVPLGGNPSAHKRLSCVTEDGIELAARTVRPDGTTMLFTEAVHVERRRVRPDEAQPSARLLSVASWVAPEHLQPADAARRTGAQVDHEVALRATARGERSEEEVAAETRGHFRGWTYAEVSHGSSPDAVTIENKDVMFTLTATAARSHGSSVRPGTLILLVLPPARPALRPAGGRPGRVEHVLGEACEYIDLQLRSPARVEECRTRDGIVLKRLVHKEDGNSTAFEAVEVRRGAAALPSVISQSAVLDPARWGFPH